MYKIIHKLVLTTIDTAYNPTNFSGCMLAAETAEAAEERRLSAKARGTGSASVCGAPSTGAAVPTTVVFVLPGPLF